MFRLGEVVQSRYQGHLTHAVVVHIDRRLIGVRMVPGRIGTVEPATHFRRSRIKTRAVCDCVVCKSVPKWKRILNPRFAKPEGDWEIAVND